MNAVSWALTLGKFVFVFVPLAMIVFMIVMERKGASLIQDRFGPNRTDLPIFGGLRFFGLIQNFADGIKLFTKELVVPKFVHKGYYTIASMIPFAVAIIIPGLLPWFAPIAFEDGGQVFNIPGEIVSADGGLLIVFALSGLAVYGTVLGGWASNNKYSILGGLRATSMMISYEVSMGLSVMGLFLLAGSLRLPDIVAWQSQHVWGVLVQPVAFIIYVVSLIAETGRAPFDMAEAEPEIVGHHLEYSGMRFGLFYMGEYVHIVVNSLLIATLFLGGYDIPVLHTAGLQAHLGAVAAVILAVCGLSAFGLMAMMIRWIRIYRTSGASDVVNRSREYGFMSVCLAVAGVICLAAAAVCAVCLHPEGVMIGGQLVYPLWTSLITALVQFGVLFVKALLFCWLWVWVRWSLPRFRYDQVMSLGWKVFLNLALANLLITAVVAKIVEGN